MKKLIGLILIMLVVLSSFAQTPTQKLARQTVKTSGTYTWVNKVDNIDALLYTSVGFVVNTVNTSNMQASFYLYGSWNGVSYGPILTSLENYTWTQGSNIETVETLVSDSWYYPFIKATVVATSDAQTVNVTPYIKTVRKW